jgi:hypothetical protein
MSSQQQSQLTFAILDRELGLPELPPATGEEFPLPAWYRAVRDVRIEKLGVEDICRACRQRIHSGHVVPIALQILKVQPLAGEMYDGELLMSLAEVEQEYWRCNAAQAQLLRDIVMATRSQIDNDSQSDISRLLAKLPPP